MCQHVLILAERNSQQYISQCEHGTVHLLWDGVGLHLPAEAFKSPRSPRPAYTGYAAG